MTHGVTAVTDAETGARRSRLRSPTKSPRPIRRTKASTPDAEPARCVMRTSPSTMTCQPSPAAPSVRIGAPAACESGAILAASETSSASAYGASSGTARSICATDLGSESRSGGGPSSSISSCSDIVSTSVGWPPPPPATPPPLCAVSRSSPLPPGLSCTSGCAALSARCAKSCTSSGLPAMSTVPARATSDVSPRLTTTLPARTISSAFVDGRASMTVSPSLNELGCIAHAIRKSFGLVNWWTSARRLSAGPSAPPSSPSPTPPPPPPPPSPPPASLLPAAPPPKSGSRRSAATMPMPSSPPAHGALTIRSRYVPRCSAHTTVSLVARAETVRLRE